MVEIGRIRCRRGGETLLNGLSMKVANGKIYGVFGLPRTGKSTLAAALAGALPTEEGFIRINGFDMEREPLRAKGCLGYLPEGTAFYPNMTVYELLDFVARVKEVREDRRFIHVHELMEQFSLEALRDRRVGSLDGLHRAYLGLAQACVGNPEILILDDPTKGLSADDRRQVREMILELNEKDKTVFLFSSFPAELAVLCHEVMLLENGALTNPAPSEEWMEGELLTLRVEGEREAVLARLSELPQLISCSVVGKDEAATVYRLRSKSPIAAELRVHLRGAGFAEPVTEELPLSEVEEAYRNAVLAANRKPSETKTKQLNGEEDLL